MQRRLKDKSPKPRGSRQLCARSLLIGKLFDESGDRLTPSHSRKNGHRLRYYISRRLVTERAKQHKDGWRLPAEELETMLAELTKAHLITPATLTALLPSADAAQLHEVQSKISALAQRRDVLALLERVDLQPGQLSITLDIEATENALNVPPNAISSDTLTFVAPFQVRRRGVVVKLQFGAEKPEIDLKLVRNVAKGQRWLKMLIKGKTFAEIAQDEGTSKRRVQQLVELGMLAPETLEKIASGTQPFGLTSDYLVKTGFPIDRAAQRVQFAQL